MLTRIAQYGLRLIGVSSVLTAGAAFVAPPLAERAQAAELESAVTTTQTMKLGTYEDYQADLRAAKEAEFKRTEPITAHDMKRHNTRPVHVGHGQQKAIGQVAPKVIPASVVPKPTPTVAASTLAATAAPVHTASPVPQEPKPKPIVHTTAPKPVVHPSPKPTPKPTPKLKRIIKKVVHIVNNEAKIAGVLAFARAQLGERYVMGGIGPFTWDCSGLTLEAFKAVGIDIGGHGVHFQYNLAHAKGYLVPFSQKKAGDLVFYGTPGNFSHVAIYSGGGRIIEAANPARPVIERPYWGTPYHMVARFIR